MMNVKIHLLNFQDGERYHFLNLDEAIEFAYDKSQVFHISVEFEKDSCRYMVGSSLFTKDMMDVLKSGKKGIEICDNNHNGIFMLKCKNIRNQKISIDKED